MKKALLFSAVFFVHALPVAASADPATDTSAKTAPAAAAEKVELYDGSTALIEADGSVKISLDKGKTWLPAPDGKWETASETYLTTKGGKKVE